MSVPQRLRSILFDLDGTLADSHPGIAAAAGLAVACILPERGPIDFKPFIGPPIREIFRRALGIEEPETIEALARSYRSAYDTQGCLCASLYPGVDSTLKALSDNHIPCFVVTNKPILPSERMLQHLGIRDHFRAVVSPDSRTPGFRNKSEMAASVIAAFDLPPSATALVGDSPDDAQAARDCGLSFFPVHYGYGVPGQAPATTRALNTMPELLPYVS